MRILPFSVLTYYGLEFHLFLCRSDNRLSSAASGKVFSAAWRFCSLPPLSTTINRAPKNTK